MWSFVLTFVMYMPWVAISLMAGMALYHRKGSKLLMLQALGAAAMFVLGMGQWLVDVILTWLNAGTTIISATHAIFSFLLFVALAAFAGGYCVERFATRKAMVVTAKVVDPAAK